MAVAGGPSLSLHGTVVVTVVTIAVSTVGGLAPPRPATHGWQPHSPVAVAKPTPASVQQFSSYQPTPPVAAAVTTPSNAWVSFDPLFAIPFAASKQQFLALGPEQVPTATTPHGWEGQQLEYRFARSFPSSAQQFLTLGPERVPSALDIQGVYAQPPDLFGRAFPVTAQQFASFTPQGFITSTFPDGWRGAQYDVRFGKPFPVASQQFAHFQFPVAANAAIATPGWEGIRLDYAFAKPFPVPSQQYAAFQARGAIFSTTPQGYSGFQLEYLFAKPFPASSQQFLALGPQRVPLASDVQGWLGLQLEYRFATPFPVGAQQYAAFQPQGRIVSTFPDGWRGYQLDYQVGKPFPVSAQQFLALPHRSVPIVATPGWEGIRLDHAFARPYPAAVQQYGGFFVGPPSAPQGWHGYQLNLVFGKGFPAALQQHFAFGRDVAIPLNTKVHGWQNISPERIASLYPVGLQQYEARGLPTIAPSPPEVTSLPGHGDWPRHLKKPVRPIWDRRPDPYPTPAPEPDIAPDIAPAQTPPVETKAPDGKSDLSGLARLLAPEAPPRPAKAKPAKPRRLLEAGDTVAAALTATWYAHAHLEDAADTAEARGTLTMRARVAGIDSDRGYGAFEAAATTEIVGRSKITEDRDTLTAQANWNDDELALSLLFGAINED